MTDTRHSEQSEHPDHSGTADRPTSALLIVLAWLIVALPLAYGLWQTLVTAFKLLGG